MVGSMIAYGLAALYGAIAFVCLAATLAEGMAGRGRGWDAMRLAGLALALFWPLIVAILVFTGPRGVRVRRRLRDTARGFLSRPVGAHEQVRFLRARGRQMRG